MTSASLDTLSSKLNLEAQLVEQFLAVLEAEWALLKDGKTNDLADTTARKEHFAQALDQAGKERETALAALGLPAGRPGLEQAAKQSPQVDAQVTRLFGLAEKAKQLNENNGVAIQVYLQHAQKMLDELNRLAGIGDVYDASGKTKTVANPGQPRLKPIKAG
jgi:flagella synthesis protein FlgN